MITRLNGDSMFKKLMESYKPLIAIPVIITLLSVILLASNGLNEGIDLKGGSLAVLSLEKSISSNDLKVMIEDGLNTTEVSVLSIDNNKATVQIGSTADVVQLTNLMKGTATISSFSSVGPVLSAQSLKSSLLGHWICIFIHVHNRIYNI